MFFKEHVPSRVYSSLSIWPSPCPLVQRQGLGFQLHWVVRFLYSDRPGHHPHNEDSDKESPERYFAYVPTPSGFILLEFLSLSCSWAVSPLTKRHICVLILPFIVSFILWLLSLAEFLSQPISDSSLNVTLGFSKKFSGDNAGPDITLWELLI